MPLAWPRAGTETLTKSWAHGRGLIFPDGCLPPPEPPPAGLSAPCVLHVPPRLAGATGRAHTSDTRPRGGPQVARPSRRPPPRGGGTPTFSAGTLSNRPTWICFRWKLLAALVGLGRESIN